MIFMLIGFDASRAFNKNRTGTENYSFQILSNILKIDHTNNYHIYIRPFVEVPDLAVHPYNFITIPFPRLWTQAGLALQTFKDKDLDVLFVPSHTLPLIRRPALKTVITVHDLGAEYLPQTHQLKQRLYLKLMTNYQLKTATHIIAVSEATKKDLIQKAGIPQEKISVIYEGYNKELFRPKKPVSAAYPYFLFVGTIQPRKNLDRLIKAYAKFLQHPSVTTHPPQLVLVGAKGWLSDTIYKLPSQLGLEDKIKFLGYVPDKDLPKLYQEALALVFPSLFEGFGLPILEAMASGCPVLTSNLSSLPEAAGKAGLLVNPYSEEEVSQGLIQIMDGKTREKLIQAGLQQVKKFSWQKAARETLKILFEVNAK